MTGGALFVVILPRKELENNLKNKEKATQLVSELNENKNCEHKLNIEEARNVQNGGGTVPKTCQDNEKSCGLFKSSGDDVVDGSSSSGSARSSIKSSWDDLKQAIKPKKNKLKITHPESIADVITFHDVPNLETMLLEIIKRLKIVNASWTPTKNNEFWQVIFSVNNNTVCEETLQVLRTFGIGSKYQSSISIIPCALYYQSQSKEEALKSKEAEEQQSSREGRNGQPHDHNASAWTKFTSSVSARNNLAQVLEDVRADAALTFDWLNLLIIASLVSAIGLVENSVVILVASMLISPLMGPITAGTIGTIVQDRSLQRLGLQNEIAGLFLGLIIGFIFGLAICALDETYGIQNWPTTEMMSRCTVRAIWVNVAVAIPSGVGVALAVLGEYTASLVGVAISASLLPPAVNAGLLWAMALVHFASSSSDVSRWSGVITSSVYSTDPVVELIILGAVSLCLTLVNIVFIFLAGVAVYKVKDVSRFKNGYISWWRASRSVRRPTGGGDNGWNINRWYNETTDMNGNAQTSLETQSDTVTFRNRLSGPKNSVQNMQDFYLKQTQNNGFKTSFDANHTLTGIENTDSIEQNTDTSIEDSLEKNKTPFDEKPKSRKVSFGVFEENKVPINRISLTIDERKRELFSSSKGKM